jgi:hypothetical protein
MPPMTMQELPLSETKVCESTAPPSDSHLTTGASAAGAASERSGRGGLKQIWSRGRALGHGARGTRPRQVHG